MNPPQGSFFFACGTVWENSGHLTRRQVRRPSVPLTPLSMPHGYPIPKRRILRQGVGGGGARSGTSLPTARPSTSMLRNRPPTPDTATIFTYGRKRRSFANSCGHSRAEWIRPTCNSAFSIDKIPFMVLPFDYAGVQSPSAACQRLRVGHHLYSSRDFTDTSLSGITKRSPNVSPPIRKTKNLLRIVASGIPYRADWQGKI